MVNSAPNHMIWQVVILLLPLSMASAAMVDSGQVACYNNRGEIACADPDEPFFGQDGNYHSQQPSYQDLGDGTIFDQQTGLMWSKGVNRHKVSLAQAHHMAQQMNLGGHKDWRVPNIKELYSLIDFRGYTGFSHPRQRGGMGFGRHRQTQKPDLRQVPHNAIPFINTDYFDFRYGNTQIGERYIDGQWLSRTEYVGTTMGGNRTLFGVNFADGRIKGYGFYRPHGPRVAKTFYVRFVRGPRYGHHDFENHGDGTITDHKTGLMWAQQDSKRGMNWQAALAYAQNSILAGYEDWRLPNAKELQYLVDYTRAPDVTNSAAIDPVFETSTLINEAGESDYPHFWTGTTHLDGPHPGGDAVYLAFGRAMGKMFGRIMDVHGAGAQRGDPKVGKAKIGHGPQGDARRTNNYVRLVRGGVNHTPPQKSDAHHYPNHIMVKTAEGLSPQQPGMSHQAFQPPMGTDRRGRSRRQGGFMAHWDRNQDGQVTQQEFTGPPAHFNRFDRNQDGIIAQDEVPHPPPRQHPSSSKTYY
ncbi:DUF1566 domain-containing protein [Magnetococcus sp. PR-3]|uniref:DUF1566 domain-containing protein n=1 Tax=Magnetococcus sp. PR-3 TaxID=3120355 RepID=UPI002FCE1694